MGDLIQHEDLLVAKSDYRSIPDAFEEVSHELLDMACAERSTNR